MPNIESGWMRRRVSALLSATLVLSPALAVPAYAGGTDGATDQLEQQTGTDQTPDQQTQDTESDGADGTERDAGKGVEDNDEQGSDQGAVAGNGQDGESDGAKSEVRRSKTRSVEDAAAQVEVNGATTSYGSLDDAVRTVNEEGGTLTLLQNTSENITITHDGVTITAAEGVVYSAHMNIYNANGCTISGITFSNPGPTEQRAGFDNCLELHSADTTVMDCTFNVPGGAWESKDGVLHQNGFWQPNAIAVFGGSDNCSVTGCTFTLGRVNEVVAGKEGYEGDDNVAINVIGGVSDLSISGNTMTVAEPDGVQEPGGVMFVIANGNQNGGGIDGLKISGNTLDGSADEANARFVGVSGCQGIVITDNKATGIEYGIYGVSGYGPQPSPSDFEEISNNDIDTKNTVVAASVKASDGKTYEFMTLAAAIESDYSDGATVQLTKNVTENVVIPKEKTVTVDLAGHTLTNNATDTSASGTIYNRGTLTVVDSVGGGTVDNVTHGKCAVYNEVGARATLSGGTFSRSAEKGSSAGDSGGNSYYVLLNHGTMEINDGVTVRFGEGDEYGRYSSLVENGWYDGNNNNGSAPSVLTINGGTFSGGLNTIKNDDWGELTINAGTFNNVAQAAVMNVNTATINGGTFNSDKYVVVNGYADPTMDKGELTITGGTFINGDGYDVIVKHSSTSELGEIDVTGGSFKDPKIAQRLGQGSALLLASDGLYHVLGGAEDAISAGATYMVTDSYGVVHAFLSSEDAQSFAQEDGLEVVPVTFTVTFDDCLDSTENASVEVLNGEEVTAPAAPALEGWKFLGWYEVANGQYAADPYDFSTPVTGDLTLYAKWEKLPDSGSGEGGQGGGSGETPKPPVENPTAGEEKPEGEGLAQTGDPVSFAALGGVAAAGVASLGAGLAVSRKRK